MRTGSLSTPGRVLNAVLGSSQTFRAASMEYMILAPMVTLSPNHILSTTTTKSLQSCPTLCNPRDGSPTGSPVPGILQATTLEWVAISFSNILPNNSIK